MPYQDETSLPLCLQILEASLQSEPLAMLQEVLLRNLGNMYDLYSASSEGTKRSLSNWALHITPDDFDLSSLEPQAVTG